MKYFLAGAVSVLLASAIAGLFVLWSGVVSVSTLWDGGALDDVLAYASRKSIARQAGVEANPFASDERARGAGLSHYKANCLECHGAPSVGMSEFAKGLHPPAPKLTAPRTRGMSDAELFWVVSNGIRMTGMPAFSPTHGKDEIWQIVTFVRHLGQLTEAEKSSLGEGRQDQAEHHHASGEASNEESHAGQGDAHQGGLIQDEAVPHGHAAAAKPAPAGVESIGTSPDGAKGGGARAASLQPASPEDEIIRAQRPSYPLETCVISGDDLGLDGEPIEVVIAGRLVRVCCKACRKDVADDPDAAFASIDAAVIATQKPAYPLAIDPVTRKNLGAAAVDYVHGTRLVRLADAASIPLFLENPALHLAQIDRALIEAQRPSYPLTTCVVTGLMLGGERGPPVDWLHGTTLVRFCCEECPPTFEQDPAPYLLKIERAQGAAAE